MLNQAILDYCKEKGFHHQTMDRWFQLPEADRTALWDLVRGLNMGESHTRDFMDWLEEISLRDRKAIREIVTQERLVRIFSDPRMSRNDKLKRIKEEVRRLRFPRLARIEDEIQRRIREMRLSPPVRMGVPPGLEGGAVTVQLRARSVEEMKRLVSELSRAVETKSMKEIFDLLSGKES